MCVVLGGVGGGSGAEVVAGELAVEEVGLEGVVVLGAGIRQGAPVREEPLVLGD